MIGTKIAYGELLNICAQVYDHAAIVSGPGKRDGASVLKHPSGATIVCFRGTLTNHDYQSVIDWINDFHADLVRTDGFPGRVHHGFSGSLNDLWGSVFEQLESAVGEKLSVSDVPVVGIKPQRDESWWQRLWSTMRRNYWIVGKANDATAEPIPEALPWDKAVIIVGHSKGGALAELAGVKLQHLSPIVVTYAAPMVGDLDYAANYPSNVTRIRFELDWDIVPFMPFRELGYHAVGNAVSPSGLSHDERETKMLRKIMGAMVNHKLLFDMQNNHHLTTYRPWIDGCGTVDV